MRRLVFDGVAPAEAARLALTTRGVRRPVRLWQMGQARPVAAPMIQAGAVLAPVRLAGYQALPGPSGRLDLPAVDPAGPRAAHALPNHGGRGLRLPRAGPHLRGLARAVLALDAAEIHRVLAGSIAERGVVRTWDELLRPVLVAVGLRWEATGRSVEAEHLLCEVALATLSAAGADRRPGTGRPVLLACCPQERHSLPLAALDAALAEHHVNVRTFGPDLPADALAAAARRSGPAALLLWSQSPRTADPAVLAALPPRRPPTTLLVGGSGWTARELPSRVTYVPDLPTAVFAIRAAVGV